MWVLISIDDVSPREDESILVSFTIDNGTDTQNATMGLPGGSTQEQIDAAISTYIADLNAIDYPPPPISNIQLDNLESMLLSAQTSLADSSTSIASALDYIDELRELLE